MPGVEPFYFGDAAKQLFGAYHAPNEAKPRRVGVVMCYSIGQEYLCAHRTFCFLAKRLAGEGFPVLRFDYYGTGDSAGDSDEGCLRQWRQDVTSAVEELKGISGLEKVCLVGCRLGASLALLASGERSDVDGMVLWDPVLQGESYVKQLFRLHRSASRVIIVRPIKRAGVNVFEIVGFPITEYFIREASGMNLLSLPPISARKLLLIDSGLYKQNRLFTSYLEQAMPWLEKREIPEGMAWYKLRQDLGPVSQELINGIAGWVCEKYS